MVRKGSEYTEKGVRGVADGMVVPCRSLSPSLPLARSLALYLSVSVLAMLARMVVVAVASKKMERKEDGWNGAQG